MFAANPGNDEGLYHALAPGEAESVRLAVHMSDNPTSFTPRLRALASQVDPVATISRPGMLSEVFSLDRYFWSWSRRFLGVLIGVLVALSASGIYALMSFTVAERTREIGIRSALGARQGRIFATVARRSLAQLGVGVILGAPLAAELVRSLQGDLGTLPNQSPLVVAVFVVLGVLVLIGLPACAVPTLRALRIMPTEALREGG